MSGTELSKLASADSHRGRPPGDRRMTSDSNHLPPPDNGHPRPEAGAEAFDDEAVELGGTAPVADEGSALSFSGKSAVRTGGSSVIRSWNQLVKETAAEDDDVSYDPPAGPDAAEAASDRDLLREVLADEPPPSAIILKDPSATDQPAFRPPSRKSDPESVLGDLEAGPASGGDPFALPPDLAATRPDGASGDGRSSSRVDLLNSPVPRSSGSLQRTDEVGPPPLVRPPSGESSDTLLGGPIPGGTESSAVDLGSEPVIDLPFPLGLDSTVGSSVVRPAAERTEPLSKPEPDSGTVDLLRSSAEFNLPPSAGGTSPSWAAAREDLPPTVPLVPAGKARLTAWAGGGAVGLVAGLAACVAAWFGGFVPDRFSTTTRPPTQAATVAEPAALADARSDARRQAELAGQVRAELAAKAKEADRLAAQLAEAKAAADQAKQAQDRVAALAGQLQQAQAAQADLKGSMEKLTDAKAQAEAAVRDADAGLARVRDQLAKAEAAERHLNERLARAEAARNKATEFVAEVGRRLQAAHVAAAGAPATELLAALDRALAAPPASAGETALRQPSAAAGPLTPEHAEQVAQQGYAAIRENDPAAAERAFAQLAAGPESDAISQYYLGLARWKQGRYAEAEAAFRKGAALERQNRPNPADVGAAFERLTRADRALINRYRY